MKDILDFDALHDSIRGVPQEELLVVALLAMVIGWVGTALLRRRVAFGKMLSAASTLTLGLILIVVVLQLAHIDPRFAVAVGNSPALVEGGETRVELSRDGHFWLDADVNGKPVSFLVDTGATLTAISQSTAEKSGVVPSSSRMPIRLETANGPIEAKLAEVEELSFGNITAKSVDVVIAPNLGETNVIGMNVLSQLASWRVEGKTLILVPATEPAATD